MADWTHRAVCESCSGVGPDGGENWEGAPKTSESHAGIQAETHDRRKHGGTETAEVREVNDERL